jgi:hypothetical protein
MIIRSRLNVTTAAVCIVLCGCIIYLRKLKRKYYSLLLRILHRNDEPQCGTQISLGGFELSRQKKKKIKVFVRSDPK